MKCSYSCNEVPGRLEAYGDISGIGVLLGFLIMSWSSIAILIIHYLLAFNPHLDSFKDNEDIDLVQSRKRPANFVDLIVYKVMGFTKLPKRFRLPRGALSKKIEKPLQQSVLAIADSQLLAGIAILTSGYYTMTCGLSAYHWQTIVYLGWFSCLTHLSTLSALRTYLHLNRAARAWRLWLMTILAILVFVALIPTGHFDFLDEAVSTLDYSPTGVDVDLGSGPVHLGEDGHINKSAEVDTSLGVYVFRESPAVCFFKGDLLFPGIPPVSMILSQVLLGYGFTVRVAKLFKATSTKLSKLLSEGLETGCNRCIHQWARVFLSWQPKHRLLILKASTPFILAFWGTIRLFCEVYSSMALEVTTLCYSGIWGTFRLIETRRNGPSDENSWTFGQVIPLVLLAAPLCPVFEMTYNAYFNTRRGSSSGDSEYSIASSDLPTDGQTRALEVQGSTEDSSHNSLLNPSHHDESSPIGSLALGGFAATNLRLQVFHASHSSRTGATTQILAMEMGEPENTMVSLDGNNNELDRFIKDCKETYHELHGVSTLLTLIASTTYWLGVLLVSSSQLFIEGAYNLLPFVVVPPVMYLNMVSRYFLELIGLHNHIKRVIRIILPVVFAAVCVLIWYIPMFYIPVF